MPANTIVTDLYLDSYEEVTILYNAEKKAEALSIPISFKKLFFLKSCFCTS